MLLWQFCADAEVKSNTRIEDELDYKGKCRFWNLTESSWNRLVEKTAGQSNKGNSWAVRQKGNGLGSENRSQLYYHTEKCPERKYRQISFRISSGGDRDRRDKRSTLRKLQKEHLGGPGILMWRSYKQEQVKHTILLCLCHLLQLLLLQCVHHVCQASFAALGSSKRWSAQQVTSLPGPLLRLVRGCGIVPEGVEGTYFIAVRFLLDKQKLGVRGGGDKKEWLHHLWDDCGPAVHSPFLFLFLFVCLYAVKWWGTLARGTFRKCLGLTFLSAETTQGKPPNCNFSNCFWACVCVRVTAV